MQLTVAGKQMTIKIEDWMNAVVMEGYFGLINTLSLGNAVFPVNLVDFIQVDSIFGFDCTPSGNSAGCEQISVPVYSSGTDYSISLIFGKTLPENAQLFVLSELEAVMTINKSGEAVISPSV